MFTEGLDTNALRWVREGSVPSSMSSYRTRIDPVTGVGSAGRGFAMPPPAKFRSGHLPLGAIPRPIPDDTGDSVSGSDPDLSTDSEGEGYGGRYSLDSSPQDGRIPNGSVLRRRKPLQGRPPYGSDYMYSDVSSSMETVGRRAGSGAERLAVGSGRYPVGVNGYSEDEDELSNSVSSSEFSSTQVESNNRAVPHARVYASEGYASSVPSQLNAESAAQKELQAKDVQNGEFSDDDYDDDNDDVPSAPPFCSSVQEINQGSEQIPVSGANITPRIAESRGISNRYASSALKDTPVVNAEDNAGSRTPNQFVSAQGPWLAVIAYDACVRLCLHAWAKGCEEAPTFLENECALLRNVFGLQQVLLQSEDELLLHRSSERAGEGAAPKPKNIIGKMKVQVRKVKMTLDPPTGCSFSSLKAPMIKPESVQYCFTNLQSTLSSRWKALRKSHVAPRAPVRVARQSLAYVHAGTQYIRQVSGLLKSSVTTLRNSSSSYEDMQETYSCLLRLKSSAVEDAIRMQPGSGETHVFFPDSLGDDLIVEVRDSKGKLYGRVLAQVAAIAEDPSDKLRWWSIYHEPEHDLVGKVQLYINYSTSLDENSHLKCGSIAETVAYDLVLEVAMKAQHFQQRNLLLHGQWKWLLAEFASYYGVSEAYTKLRYLSFVMDVATPTADCLTLVYNLLLPVVMKGRNKSTLSHQENRILGDIKDQIEQILAQVFENYKSLDESLPSGIVDVFRPATGLAAPVLAPAVKLYSLLRDILSPEAQINLCRYFQVAAKKRSKWHLAETDEFVTNNNEGNLMDALTISTAYQKMKSLCLNIRNEIFTDIEIHNQHILPSFIDLPNLSSSIYSADLFNRLRAFLIACPPSGPTPPVADLVVATANFQRDLDSLNINPVKGGVDAKELFHLYIVLWIQDKRLSLLESCKLDKVKWSGVRTQHSTTPFVDDMYDRLKETLNDYEIIICRWPEYTSVLENAMADIEKAIVEALDKQYADVLLPLKENLTPKKFGFKYVQKLAKRSGCPYVAPDELGILLNSMKRMLDVLRPKIETQLKSWGSCIPDGANSVPGERLSEVTVMLRAKFRNYLQAVVEKLAENSRLHSGTKLKKILQDSKETVVESDLRSRMQPLIDQMTSTINHLHTVFETHVFIAICRGYWDRMGQDVLNFLENRKENRSWYKGSRVAVAILDDTLASQMQRLLGNALQDKDLEPPRSIMEVRSMLCKDTSNRKDNTFYY
ncbi:uncharacterized protein LOC131161393 isoform X2 [Malania oleifera]|uniref:uncharacterized protein LOC131161393 isoform X2 n=1 Tax=Malania oleifera TaxID=397392 RepID=UPI0025AE47BC|nr:uncharacterized protein LOC131161393 isoform X2 [Malania oleifera]